MGADVALGEVPLRNHCCRIFHYVDEGESLLVEESPCGKGTALKVRAADEQEYNELGDRCDGVLGQSETVVPLMRRVA